MLVTDPILTVAAMCEPFVPGAFRPVAEPEEMLSPLTVSLFAIVSVPPTVGMLAELPLMTVMVLTVRSTAAPTRLTPAGKLPPV